MSNATFERFNYALRPAKNVERKMICEAAARLSRIKPLSSYRYIGFGAIGFVDFTLLHQRLGIKRMHSIEIEEGAKKRVEFNRPYSCIKMEWGYSTDILPKFSWDQHTIIWLDYDKPINANILKDIKFLSVSLVPGSCLIVTVTADPGDVDPDKDTGERRLADLIQAVTRDRIPNGVDGRSLAKWGLAKVSRQILHAEILKLLSDRNAAKPASEKIHFQQLFNFHYADGTKMLTMGGLLLNPAQQKSLPLRQFRDLDFIRDSDDTYLIESPVLTLREIRYLDERLPRATAKHPRWLPERDRERYRKLYRYFPTFSEVEL